ncbi:MAG TPA: tetratricopeptide repeat protein [Pirellulaceae bacterium]|nr:tetratricopeptide repeat protein [Pirellulaceae bacterium]
MIQNSRVGQLSHGRKIVYSLTVLLLFFGTLEATLALLGIKATAETQDLFVGFQSGLSLFVKDGDRFVTNPQKLSFFNDVSFQVVKPANTVRIMSLGGSTTYGHPYDNRLSYNAWLEARLNAANPESTWEVVNCGGISYASYRLAKLMEELVEYEPDIVLVYTGQNEFLEERTYRELRNQNPIVAKAIAIGAKFRTFGLLSRMLHRQPGSSPSESLLAAEVDTILERYGPEAYERDDRMHEQVVEHFRFSLQRIVSLARGTGAEVILIPPASNLRDFSPFRSQHYELSLAEVRRYERAIKSARSEEDPDLALAQLETAVGIDARYAEGLFEYARALLNAGESQKAREYFVRAKDEDVCPLRAPEAISNAMREVAEATGVAIVDFPVLVDERCRAEFGYAIPGSESFLDHVHPNTAVHRALGYELYERVVAAKRQPLRPLTTGEETKLEDRVLSSVSQYDHGMALHTLAMTLSWSGKTEEALPVIEAAVAQLPNDSEVVYEHGHILEKLGRNEEALSRFHEALRLNPSNSLARASLGTALLLQGDFEIAAEHLRRAVADTPDRAPISVRIRMRLTLAACLKELGDEAGAREVIAQALAIDPTSENARQAAADLFP